MKLSIYKWEIIFIVSYVINQAKIETKKKNLYSQHHQTVTKGIISSYCVSKPRFLDIEDLY